MKTVIILGAGRSVNEGIEKDLWGKIKNSGDVWSLNYMFMIMPYLPHREIWVDHIFFSTNADALQNLYNQKVEMIAKRHQIYNNRPEIKTYGTTREANKYFGKLATQHDLIYYGRMGLVGSFALALAIAENYERIFLIGYDFGTKTINDKFTHCYQQQLQIKQKGSGVGVPMIYRTVKDQVHPYIVDYDVYSREKDVKIYNVSLSSNLNCFEKISYEKFFELL